MLIELLIPGFSAHDPHTRLAMVPVKWGVVPAKKFKSARVSASKVNEDDGNGHGGGVVPIMI